MVACIERSEMRGKKDTEVGFGGIFESEAKNHDKTGLSEYQYVTKL